MGRNSLEGASQQIQELGLKKALIVTDAVCCSSSRDLIALHSMKAQPFSGLLQAHGQSVTLHIETVQVLVKVGAVKAITNILEKIGIQYEIYDGVEPNPTIEQVLQLVSKHKHGCQNFLIIATLCYAPSICAPV